MYRHAAGCCNIQLRHLAGIKIGHSNKRDYAQSWTRRFFGDFFKYKSLVDPEGGVRDVQCKFIFSLTLINKFYTVLILTWFRIDCNLQALLD